MVTFPCFIALLIVAVSGQTASKDIIDDLLNIFNNGEVTLQNCSTTEVLESDIKYTLYKEENQQTGIPLSSANFDEVDKALRVIFIIHGWLQTGNQSWVLQMKDTYLNKTNSNIIVVDWSVYSGNVSYGAAFCAVPFVGNFTGDLIYNLTVTPGASLNKVQINAFSFGGHVAGYAGQRVQFKTGGSKIGRINGLDIAGPGYLDLPLNQRLDASDALFVQGIHTSNLHFGYSNVYGTVDFEVNAIVVVGCGVIQNGCPVILGVQINNTSDVAVLLPHVFCGHIRAASYFTESINSKDFFGVPCSNCTTFARRGCKWNTRTIMGENCPPRASGVKFLNTNLLPPFALGEEGLSTH